MRLRRLLLSEGHGPLLRRVRGCDRWEVHSPREAETVSWEPEKGVPVGSFGFSTAGSEGAYSAISQGALELPYVTQLPQSPLPQPRWHGCQPQLHFPSQEYSADAGLYLAATARYSLFSLRS